LDITPGPIAFEALRRAADIPDLCTEDGPGRFMAALKKHGEAFNRIVTELYAQNPPCPCGEMLMLDAEEKRHYCLS
jgi:hypothetical protein